MEQPHSNARLMQSHTAIAIMAKAPAPGRSKTRLMPILSAEQAAAMSAAFLADVLANLALAGQTCPITPYIAYAPAGAEAGFTGIAPPGTRMLLADGTTAAPEGVVGFGRCLLHAINAMLALGHPAACVLNADSPNLPTRLLCAAHQALSAPGERIVLGPAEDGGYYLLGMQKSHAHLFADIAWSSSKVAQQTRQRAAELGLPIVELESWYDVDEPATFYRLLHELDCPATPEAFAAPHSAARVRSLGLVAAANIPQMPHPIAAHAAAGAAE